MSGETAVTPQEQVEEAATTATPKTASSVFASIVGEDKRYKDPESLAIGKINADKAIERQTADLKSYKERIQMLEKELEGKKTMEQYIDEVIRQGGPMEADGEDKVPTSQPVDVKVIADMVRESLAQESKTQQEERNLGEFSRAVASAYGDKVEETLAKKALELGLGVDYLKSIAKASPRAAKEIIGIKPLTPEGFVGSSVSNIGALASSDPDVIRLKELEELRKTNPREYGKHIGESISLQKKIKMKG